MESPSHTALDLTALDKLLPRERRRRMLLLQRLNVLEKRNFQERQRVLAIVDGDRDGAPVVPDVSPADNALRSEPIAMAKRLMNAPSGRAAADWSINMVESCVNMGRSNASLRLVMAMLLAKRQVLEHKVSRLAGAERADLNRQVRVLGRQASGRTGHSDLLFQFEKTAKDQASQSAVFWEFDPAEGDALAAQAKAISVHALVEYVRLSANYQSQLDSTKMSLAFGSDLTALSNLGFAVQSSAGGGAYVFDEPDGDATITYTADDSGKLKVKSATMAKLIEKLTDPANQDLHFRFTLLLTIPMVSAPLEVLDLLMQRYAVPSVPNMTPNEASAFQTARLAPIQIKVLGVLKSWLHGFGEDIWGNAAVMGQFEQHMMDLCDAAEPWSQSSAKTMLDQAKAKRAEFEERERARIASPPEDPASTGDGGGVGDSTGDGPTWASTISEDDFLAAICMGDADVFCAIHPREFLDQSWSRSADKAPNITAMIARFNRMSSFVQVEILSQDSRPKRAASIKRFIGLAGRFRKVNNYSAVFAIYAGLNANAIYRLKQSWEAVPAKVRAEFDELKALFSVDHNSRRFRAEMKNVIAPCIPHLGLLLQDLTFIDDGNKDRSGHLINVYKLNLLAERIGWVHQCQSSRYRIEYSADVARLIDRNFRVVDDDELWERSQRAEPRLKQAPA